MHAGNWDRLQPPETLREISGLENGLMLVAVAVKDRLFLNSKTCTSLKKLTSVSVNFTFAVQTLHHKMHLTNRNVGSLLMQDKCQIKV